MAKKLIGVDEETGELPEVVKAALSNTYARSSVAGVLPVLRIDTAASAPIVSKDDYVTCTYTFDDQVVIAGRVRGRGNTTWGNPKKPYKVKLDTATSLLGLPASKDFALLANYFDTSGVRNAVYFNVGARSDGLDYTPQGRFVELVVNGEYYGVYQLSQTVELAADRVNATAANADTGLGLTGAYLMEIDTRYVTAGDPGFTTTRGVMIAYDTPDGENATRAAYIADWVQDFEDALFASTWLDPTTGYAKYIDRDSFIDWYLCNELLKNADSKFFSSCKLYKTRDTATVPGTLHMGPLWDADLSMGLVFADLGGSNASNAPTGWWTKTAVWFNRLLTDPAFIAALKVRWAALSAAVKSPTDGIAPFIDARMRELAQARGRDQTVWTGSSPYQVGKLWRTEAATLKSWIATRIAWLDTEIAALGTNASSYPFTFPATFA